MLLCVCAGVRVCRYARAQCTSAAYSVFSVPRKRCGNFKLGARPRQHWLSRGPRWRRRRFWPKGGTLSSTFSTNAGIRSWKPRTGEAEAAPGCSPQLAKWQLQGPAQGQAAGCGGGGTSGLPCFCPVPLFTAAVQTPAAGLGLRAQFLLPPSGPWVHDLASQGSLGAQRLPALSPGSPAALSHPPHLVWGSCGCWAHP